MVKLGTTPIRKQPQVFPPSTSKPLGYRPWGGASRIRPYSQKESLSSTQILPQRCAGHYLPPPHPPTPPPCKYQNSSVCHQFTMCDGVVVCFRTSNTIPMEVLVAQIVLCRRGGGSNSIFFYISLFLMSLDDDGCFPHLPDPMPGPKKQSIGFGQDSIFQRCPLFHKV